MIFAKEKKQHETISFNPNLVRISHRKAVALIWKAFFYLDCRQQSLKTDGRQSPRSTWLDARTKNDIANEDNSDESIWVCIWRKVEGMFKMEFN